MESPRQAAYGTGAAVGVRPAPRLGGPSSVELRFPGCRPVRVLRDRIEDFDEKLEYWDAATEVAWVAEKPGAVHSAPSGRLVRMAERIALVRGVQIEALGDMGLVERDTAGAPVRSMQADEMLYLHPDRASMPFKTLNVGEHDLPDVVLEVDHTTDIRPGKLPVYEAWGFPELWILVPHVTSRRPVGVTIHVLDGARYRQVRSSRAFPGWTAAEIQKALTEPALSPQTDRVLVRVGLRLGALEGALPEDGPLVRALSRRARLAGQSAERVAAVRAVLAARGIRLADPLPAGPDPFAGASREALMAAAFACADEADFWRRLGRPRGRR